MCFESWDQVLTLYKNGESRGQLTKLDGENDEDLTKMEKEMETSQVVIDRERNEDLTTKEKGW